MLTRFFVIFLFLIVISENSLARNNYIGISIANLRERSELEITALKQALEAAGDTFKILDAQSSSSKQNKDILRLVASGVDALIVLPQDADAIETSVAEAIDAGIKVISYQYPVANPNVLYVAYDEIEVGRIQARELLNSAPSGEYVVINGPKLNPAAALTRIGQQEVLQSAISNGQIKIVDETFSDDWLPSNAWQNMETILNANENNVSAVLAPDDKIAEAALYALEKSGIYGVPISGQGTDYLALSRIATGAQTVSAWKDGRKLGVRVAEIASALAEGASIGTIPGATLFKYPAVEVALKAVLLEPLAVTQENLNIAVDAGFIDLNLLCSEASAGEAAICRSKSNNLPVIDICFGSDRSIDSSSKHLRFTHDRALELTLGFARVSIPEDNHKFGNRERPSKRQFLWIDFGVEAEDAKKHFLIQNIEALSEVGMSNRAKVILKKSNLYDNHVLVFVHGFNVAFEDALYTVAQIAWDIGFDGLPCIYSWPSMAKLSLTAYNYDRNSAHRAQTKLANFLEIVSKFEGAKKVSIIAHSMGNVALLEASKKIHPTNEADDKIFSEIVLAAPDIDRDVFMEFAPAFSKLAKGVTLYASANDRALQASKELAASIPRAGDVPSDGPLTLPLIDTIDTSSVSDYVFGLNHSYFASNRSVVSDIGRLLLSGKRPPSLRDTTIRMVEKENGTKYWKFPN